ncbi:MAG: 3-phosphoglycerate dehydrogenase [Bacteroidales bacterium]|nr:3-phosphoglycerate dehydrogenase [Bacteroidales bacterium]
MKVLLATVKPFAPQAVGGIREIIESAGHTLEVLEKYDGEDALVSAVGDADALIVRSDKVTSRVISAAKNLKIVVRAGAGYDNLDLDACTQASVVAMNTPAQNSNAVAELAVAMMIYMSRNQFTPTTGCEISGKRIGIQAFGNVGRLVAAKAISLGMKASAVDPYLAPERISECGVTPARDLEQLYSGNDFVSIHIPATPETTGSIGYDLLTRMPAGACLVNTARKEVIDEDGLLRALQDRPDLKYVTDIAPDNYAILKEKFGQRVFATPSKMGAQTKEANVNAALAAARQICGFFASGDRKFQLNK